MPSTKDVINILLLFSRLPRPWKPHRSPPLLRLPPYARLVTPPPECRGPRWAMPRVLGPGWPPTVARCRPRHKKLHVGFCCCCSSSWHVGAVMPISVSQAWFLLGCGPGWGVGTGMGRTHCEARSRWGEAVRLCPSVLPGAVLARGIVWGGEGEIRVQRHLPICLSRLDLGPRNLSVAQPCFLPCWLPFQAGSSLMWPTCPGALLSR